MNINSNAKQYITYLSIILKYTIPLALISFPIFTNLDSISMRVYDESRLAISAYEMAKSNDFLVVSYENRPEMWSTKPPLQIWFQVFFIKLIGFNELAVRLPSAIFAFLTCILLWIFSVKHLKNFWLGVITMLILVSTHGYVEHHGIRTADYDSQLTFFTTLSSLSFFLFLEKKKNLYLYLCFISLMLAVLTKSIAGLLFIPAFAIFTLLQKQLVEVLKNRHFYLGIVVFLVPVLSYYFIREQYNPGYLEAVYNNELGGRYLETLDNHKQEFSFYFDKLLEKRFKNWIWILPCGFLVGILVKHKKMNQFAYYLGILAIAFFLVISSAETKLVWYDTPLFPILAFITSFFIYFIFRFLSEFLWLKNSLKYNIFPFIFLVLTFKTPYSEIIDKTYKPKEYKNEVEFYELSYYLKDVVRGKQDISGYDIAYFGYNANILFYTLMLEEQGIKTKIVDWKNLSPKDKVIVSQGYVKESLKKYYNYKILERFKSIEKYEIISRKE